MSKIKSEIKNLYEILEAIKDYFEEKNVAEMIDLSNDALDSLDKLEKMIEEEAYE